MRQATVIALTLVLAVSPAFAEEIKPEMVVRFTKGGVACLERDHLQELTMYAMNGERTKTNAMMIDRGGDCIMLSTSKRYKVLHAEYNDPAMDIGLVEIVGEGTVTLYGAWAYTVGAEQVQSKPSRRKN